MPDLVPHQFKGEKDARPVKIIYDGFDDAGNPEERVSSADILIYVLDIPGGQQDPRHTTRLAAIMERLGWSKPDNKITTHKQVRGYTRPRPETPST